jgi:hypothetical protein
MALQTVNGGTQVGPGYYFCTKGFEFEVVGEAGGTLPGTDARQFVAIPFPLLFLVIPIVGFAFLIFLPAIGFALVAYAAILKLTGQAPKLAKPEKNGH